MLACSVGTLKLLHFDLLSTVLIAAAARGPTAQKSLERQVPQETEWQSKQTHAGSPSRTSGLLWGARQRHHQAQIRTEQSTHWHRNPGFPVNGGALWRQKQKKFLVFYGGGFLCSQRDSVQCCLKKLLSAEMRHSHYRNFDKYKSNIQQGTNCITLT